MATTRRICDFGHGIHAGTDRRLGSLSGLARRHCTDLMEVSAHHRRGGRGSRPADPRRAGSGQETASRPRAAVCAARPRHLCAGEPSRGNVGLRPRRDISRAELGTEHSGPSANHAAYRLYRAEHDRQRRAAAHEAAEPAGPAGHRRQLLRDIRRHLLVVDGRDPARRIRILGRCLIGGLPMHGAARGSSRGDGPPARPTCPAGNRTGRITRPSEGSPRTGS
jgi:hypothetical protein